MAIKKVRTKPFQSYNPIGKEERQAVQKVMKSGMLSDFLGKHDPKFLGGKYVRELEKRWASAHQVKHAVSFNSATSALIAGIGALGLMPGDEVLVIAFSMCISATAPLFYDAIPIFVDIEEDYYCMDPQKIESAITPRTKAILSVDLFGQSADMTALKALAQKHGLRILCDTSHAPACRYNGGFAGTFGDIGVYSLNQHKIIHCGEGGIAVTNDDELALRLQLIRNHGEAVVDDMQYRNYLNMLGGNYRMTELHAAIAIEQLKKLPALNRKRIALANHLTEQLLKCPFLTVPKIRPGSEHAYYLYPLRYHAEETGISRERYLANVRALGVPLYRLAGGYIRPLYLEPIFAEKEKFRGGAPYNLLPEDQRPVYQRGLCPVTERFYDEEFFVTSYHHPPHTAADMRDVAQALEKAALMK
jgi:dTDP-4-amino-4,6-dideoxygalactose transaminase